MKRSYVSENLSASIILVAGIVATVYVLFVFSNAIWKSKNKEKLYAEFQEDIERLEDENSRLSEQLAFQETEQFLDKYAKSNLGRVNPGERVIILKQEQEDPPLDFKGLTPSERELEILKQRPMREQWWYFFFEA